MINIYRCTHSASTDSLAQRLVQSLLRLRGLVLSQSTARLLFKGALTVKGAVFRAMNGGKAPGDGRRATACTVPFVKASTMNAPALIWRSLVMIPTAGEPLVRRRLLGVSDCSPHTSVAHAQSRSRTAKDAALKRVRFMKQEENEK